MRRIMRKCNRQCLEYVYWFYRRFVFYIEFKGFWNFREILNIEVFDKNIFWNIIF